MEHIYLECRVIRGIKACIFGFLHRISKGIDKCVYGGVRLDEAKQIDPAATGLQHFFQGSAFALWFVM